MSTCFRQVCEEIHNTQPEHRSVLPALPVRVKEPALLWMLPSMVPPDKLTTFLYCDIDGLDVTIILKAEGPLLVEMNETSNMV